MGIAVSKQQGGYSPKRQSLDTNGRRFQVRAYGKNALKTRAIPDLSHVRAVPKISLIFGGDGQVASLAPIDDVEALHEIHVQVLTSGCAVRVQQGNRLGLVSGCAIKALDGENGGGHALDFYGCHMAVFVPLDAHPCR